jgi:hypothetical protein
METEVENTGGVYPSVSFQADMAVSEGPGAGKRDAEGHEMASAAQDAHGDSQQQGEATGAALQKNLDTKVSSLLNGHPLTVYRCNWNEPTLLYIKGGHWDGAADSSGRRGIFIPDKTHPQCTEKWESPNCPPFCLFLQDRTCLLIQQRFLDTDVPLGRNRHTR